MDRSLRRLSRRARRPAARRGDLPGRQGQRRHAAPLDLLRPAARSVPLARRGVSRRGRALAQGDRDARPQSKGVAMYDHIGLKVKDLDAAVGFYSAALEPLGYVLASRDEAVAGFGPRGEPALWLYKGA